MKTDDTDDLDGEIILPGGDPTPVAPFQDTRQAAEWLNQHSAQNAFKEFKGRKAKQTLRRHKADLALFAQFLLTTGLRRPASGPDDDDPAALGPDDLYERPEAWRDITWGVVDHFVKWMLTEGYAVGSVNVRLTTVKVYAGLASAAGVIPPDELTLIRLLNKGYAEREAVNIDEKRVDAGVETRRKERVVASRIIKSTKKAKPTKITDEQARQLKHQSPDDTPLVRRNNLLMCLLLDHGLRIGEAVILNASWVDMERGVIKIKRPKVHLVQYHELSDDTLWALQRMFDEGDIPIPRRGPLLRRMNRSGKPLNKALTESGANQLVSELGRLVGLENLSPHDCRHYWANDLAQRGFDPYKIMDAGGWSSLHTPLRYIKRSGISNLGMARRSGEMRDYDAETEVYGELWTDGIDPGDGNDDDPDESG